MPRKYLRQPLKSLKHLYPASMRPGRMPRKYNKELDALELLLEASMRPGRMPRKYMLCSRRRMRRALSLQ